MITFACVLKSGGEYVPGHAQALARAVRVNLPAPHRFVCLTDMAVPGVECLSLPMNLPGWWAKLNLWVPNLLHGRIVFADLDSVVVGDLSDLARYAGSFAMLSDFLRPERPASGVMAWDADGAEARAIWEAFVRDPEGHMHACRGGGDQQFLRSVVGDDVDRLQALYPDQIVSYKVHCKDGLPEGARLVCAHGRPKPWDAEWTL